MAPRILLFPCLLAAARGAATTITTYELRTEDQVDSSCFVDLVNPRLSWKLAAVDPSVPSWQSGYRILASTSTALYSRGVYDAWDSGVVPSNDTINVIYGGTGLSNVGSSIVWSVIAFDGSGAAAAAPEPQTVTLAPRAGVDADWSGAAFLTASNVVPADDCGFYDPSNAAPNLFRTEFATTSSAVVSRASLFALTLGWGEVYLNGARLGSSNNGAGAVDVNSFAVGDEVLNPGWTNFTSRSLYTAYDVTSLLAVAGGAGAPNALAVQLASGWWNPLPIRLFSQFNLRDVVPTGNPTLRLLLVITYADGTTQTVTSAAASGSQWVTTQSWISFANAYLGEKVQLARLAQLGAWALPGYNATGWAPALLNNATSLIGPLQLQPVAAPPARVIRSLVPESVVQPIPGLQSFIVTLPFEIAGWLALRNINLPAGTQLNLTFGELLHPENGTLYDATVWAGAVGRWSGSNGGPCCPNPARQLDTITFAGTGNESYSPRFTWHSFRYVQIDGWPTSSPPPTVSQFLGLQVHTDNEHVGDFASWSAQHAAIRDLTDRSFRNNWAGGIQSDCPGRERLGYGGDMMAAAEAAILQFNVRSFYGKRVRDYADAARAKGGLPETAPYIGIKTCDSFGDGTGPMQWGSGMLDVALTQHYPYYGDSRLLGEIYPTVHRWLSLLNATADATGVLENGLPDFTQPNGACNGVDIQLEGTAFFYQQAAEAAALAAQLGNTADAAAYATLASRVQARFQALFVNASTGAVGDQVAKGYLDEQLWGMALGLVQPTVMPAAVQTVARVLEGAKNHSNTGAFATSFLYRQGADWGLTQHLLATLQQTDVPSYGVMLFYNSTALWEHWNNWVEKNSFSHAWLGSVSSFFYRSLGGVGPAPGAAGMDRILLRPHLPALGTSAAWPQQPGQPPQQPAPGTPLPWVNVTYNSIRGPVSSMWAFTPAADGSTATLSLSVSAPANVHTTVHLPVPSLSSPSVTACAGAGAPTPVQDSAGSWWSYSLGYLPSCTFTVAQWPL